MTTAIMQQPSKDRRRNHHEKAFHERLERTWSTWRKLSTSSLAKIEDAATMKIKSAEMPAPRLVVLELEREADWDVIASECAPPCSGHSLHASLHIVLASHVHATCPCP